MNPYDIDLDKLNSATKYPSIPTYHMLGDRGCLTEEVQVSFQGEELLYTEKIDGTNARIILIGGGDFFIGSREELLYFSGDLLCNPSQGIVKAIQKIAFEFAEELIEEDSIRVIYGEVYGHKIGKGAKNYTQEQNLGFRVFDTMRFADERELKELLEKPIDQIALWREQGKQCFEGEKTLLEFSTMSDATLTPRLVGENPPPNTVEETFSWLQTMLPGTTYAALDGKGGKPEGVVVRTPTRSKIAKIRFEDYERTMRKRG
jgi:hypothetical protein